jgi:hypothetical protein
VDWFHAVQDGVRWLSLENMVMTRYHKTRIIFWPAERLSASREGLLSIELRWSLWFWLYKFLVPRSCGPSWKSVTLSDDQEIPRIFIANTGPYPEPPVTIHSLTYFLKIHLRSSLILSFHLRLDFPSTLFPLGFPYYFCKQGCRKLRCVGVFCDVFCAET